MLIDIPLAVLAMTVIGWIVAFPIWLILVIAAIAVWRAKG